MSLEEPSAARKVAWPAVAAGLFFAVLAVIVAVTFEDYGISWDEEVQNIYGDKLLAFYASGFKDRAALSYMNLFFYGGFFDLVAALLNTVSTFGVYETRHLWGGVFFLGGLLGAWRLTRLLAGPRAALIAVAMLALHPVLYGHSFINPKDAPLAWLTLWVLYYACRAIAEERPRPTTVIGFGIASGLALGTRILAVPLLGYVIGGLVLGALMQMWYPRRPVTSPPSRMQHAALGLAAGLPLAYAIMAIFWPWAIQSPFNPVVALHEFTNFPWRGMILWNGEMVSANALPRNYLNVLLALQLPEHTLIGLVLAAVAGVTLLVQRWFDLFSDRRMIQYAIVIAAAVVPVVGFMILTPTVYNGLRHFLFVVPPLGVLAAIGWDRALALAAPNRAGQAGIGAVLTILLAWQIEVMVDLHPYQYVAYNRLAGGLAGAAGRFELDYWDTSLAEASHRLSAKWPKTAPEKPPVVFVCGNRLSASAFLPKYVQLTYKIEEADYFLSIVPSPCKGQVDVTKNRIIEVRREGVTLGYVIDLKAGRKPAKD